MAPAVPSNPAFFTPLSSGRYFGVLQRLDFFPDPFLSYQLLKPVNSPSVFLESARVTDRSGRYSLAAVSSEAILEADQTGVRLRLASIVRRLQGNPLTILDRLVRERRIDAEGAPAPFLGGAVGFAGYESRRWADPGKHFIQKPPVEGVPDIFFLLVSEGVLWDHREGVCYIFLHTKAGRSFEQSREQALKRVARLARRVRLCRPVSGRPSHKSSFKRIPAIRSSADRERFQGMVLKAKESIRAGDIFQANLSQSMSFPFSGNLIDAYAKLRATNPSSFFGILDGVQFGILSGSPERLLKLESGWLETRPIAGTRARGKSLGDDRKKTADLLLSPKERAEHVMLVDLERNDLGRVCEYGSVSVDELMTIENYSHVKHIVSNVRGKLRRGVSAVEAFKAFFPGGTITGTPKIRSMEIIDALEPVARGPYTGSLGYFSFTGSMDFNIIIRSLVVRAGRAWLNVGAGIVADSDPRKEYDETLYKAEAVLTALFGKKAVRDYFRTLGVGSRPS